MRDLPLDLVPAPEPGRLPHGSGVLIAGAVMLPIYGLIALLIR